MTKRQKKAHDLCRTTYDQRENRKSKQWGRWYEDTMTFVPVGRRPRRRSVVLSANTTQFFPFG